MGTPLTGSGAVTAGAFAASSAAVNLVSGGGAPAAPTGVLVTNQGGLTAYENGNGNTQALAWQPSSGATSYNVYRNGSSYASVTSPTTFTGYISGTTLTVVSVSSGSGSIAANVRYQATGIALGTQISSGNNQNTSPQLSGTPGGVGTYTVNISQTLFSSGSPGTFTAWQYVDTAATNSNAMTANQPATIYAYAVTAVNGSGESAKAYPNVYLFQNGVANQSENDFSYGLTTLNWNNTTDVQSGSVADILVDYSGGGGYQPISEAPGSPAYDLEIGAFNYHTIDVYLSNAPTTNVISLSHITRPLGSSGSDIYPYSLVTLINEDGTSAYGTPVIGGWATLKVPLSVLTMGVAEFEGYISGTTLTVTSLTSGVVPDAGGYITGAGVSAGTYISATPSGNTAPFTATVSESQTVGSSGSPVALTCQRTSIYKLDYYPPNATDITILFDNMGWTTD